MRNQLDSLFSKEMTRKQFLQQVGSALLIVFGAGALINALQPNKKQISYGGYGSSAYGGQKRT